MTTSTLWRCWPARTAHVPGSGTTSTGSARPAGRRKNGSGYSTPLSRDPTAAPRPTRAESEKAQRRGFHEPPRATLRRTVSTAAAGAGSEDEFFARLQGSGVIVRKRLSTRDPGQVTGYAVTLPSETNKEGAPVWYSGGKLSPDLTLPKLRSRWSSGPAHTGETLTFAERDAIRKHAAQAAADAARMIRQCAATDPAGAADAAWAAADISKTARNEADRIGNDSPPWLLAVRLWLVTMTIWVDAWQMQCCGEPFRLGSQVAWTLRGTDPDWLEAMLGADASRAVDAAEEHHGGVPDGTEPIRAVVTRISAVHCGYAPSPGGDPPSLYPVPGSGVLADVESADGWIPHRGDEHFAGYVVRLDR